MNKLFFIGAAAILLALTGVLFLHKTTTLT